MAIKWIATDMDGTLLTHDSRLSPRTVAAVQSAMAHGAKFVLCSGRMIEAMLSYAKDLSVNAPYVAYNGGAVYDMAAEKILHQRAIPGADAVALAKFAEDLGLHVQGYREGGYYVAYENEYSQFYAGSIRINAIPVGMPISEWINGDQMKLLIIADPKRIAEVLPLFQAQFKGKVNCINSMPYFIECIAPQVDKSEGLAVLGEILQLSPDELLAFGDGGNDCEMLQFAKYGYAMASGSQLAKDAAAYIAPPFDEDGVAQVIEEYIAKGMIGK